MLPKLFEAWRAERAPTGYRPGVTLEYLRRNLGLAQFQQLDVSRARFCTGTDGVEFEVRERVEAHLLMHLVMTEFTLEVRALVRSAARFELHHTGSIKRSGLRCRQRGDDTATQAQLTRLLVPGSALYQVLMPLDFKRLQLQRADGVWTVRLEHMGGSEVVNRMPAFRRYIRLSDEQRGLLLTALEVLAQALRSL